MTGDVVNAAVSMATNDLLVMNREGAGVMKKLRRGLKLAANLSKRARNTRSGLLIAAKEAKALRELKVS